MVLKSLSTMEVLVGEDKALECTELSHLEVGPLYTTCRNFTGESLYFVASPCLGNNLNLRLTSFS